MVEFLMDLPPNVLMEILSRLPLKTLFAVRCVCKTFLYLTSPNPYFIALHSSHATQTIVIQFGDALIPSRLLRLIDPEIDIDRGNEDNFQLRPIFQIPETRKRNVFSYSENKFVIVNSCNGLFYFANRRGPDELSLVCNPVTNEYITVPDATNTHKPLSQTTSMMLGFSPGTNQYKVLRIFCTVTAEPLEVDAEPLEVGAQVHVVGSSSWRDIEDMPSWRDIGDRPLGLDNSWDACSAFLNGVIYWLSYLETSKIIVFFDFEGEVFGDIVLPIEFGEEQLRNRHSISIGVLGGCLCVSHNVYNDHLDIWVMKKHGNQESWIKEFTIDTVRPIKEFTIDTVIRMGRRLYGLFRPLQIRKNGEILMLWIDNDLVCYDPKNKSLRFVGFDWLRLHPKAVTFTPSFVSLKDSLLVDKVMVQYVRPSGDEMDL